MEKHIKIFCDQNPKSEVKCKGCGEAYKIKTKEYLASKSYVLKCNKCDSTTTFDLTSFLKELEVFKKFC